MNKFFWTSVFLLCTQFISSQIIRVDNYYSTDTSIWQIDLNGEFQILKNTSEFYNVSGGSQIIHHGEKARISSINSYKYIFGNNKKIAQSGYQHLRYQHHLNDKIDLEAFGQLQSNPVLKIQHRSLVGLGARLDFRKQKKLGLISGLSLMYEHEKQLDTANLSNDLRTNLYFIVKTPVSKIAKWYAISYYQFVPYRFDDYRISFNTTLDIAITEKLSLYLAADLVYDSAPFEGVVNLTYTTKNGIKYKF